MSAAANERREEDRAIAHLVEPRRPVPGVLQFSLETLLLMTTLIAVCLGLAVAVPPLGTPLVVVVSLALIRTLVECRRMLRDGRPVQFGDKLSSFFGSLGFSFFALVILLLSLLFLSGAALAVASLAYDFAEYVGGLSVAVPLMFILGLLLTVAVIATSATIFFWIYWTTMIPRWTLDEPPPRKANTDGHAAP